jgi:pimeloyl-ACP methyl ester carboxylesterase
VEHNPYLGATMNSASEQSTNSNDVDSLAVMLVGAAKAPTVVFVHGWPDDASMWRNQVEALRADFRCATVTLPNFGETVSESGGCDFPTIVDRLHRTIEELGDEPVVLVTHDWGAYIGYLYEKKFPDSVKTMVAMDVGGHVQPATLRDVAMFVSYQWTLVTLWLLGGILPALGTWLTRNFARLLQVPERQASTLRSRCNYPYFYYWRSLMLPWARSRLLGEYRPQCPVLYIYGGAKPLMFHTDHWLSIVEQTGGQNVCIEQGSHWFMEAQAAQTNELLNEWLGKNATRGA